MGKDVRAILKILQETGFFFTHLLHGNGSKRQHALWIFFSSKIFEVYRKRIGPRYWHDFVVYGSGRITRFCQ